MKAALRSNPWFSVLLGILTLALFYFIKAQPSTKNTAQKRPQEYMKHIVLHDFTEAGSLKQTLQADAWDYRPEQQQSILENPYLRVYKAEGLWTIRADHGLISQPSLGSITEIRLQQHVRLEHPATPSNTALRLETSMLRYDPKANTAHSDQFVVIKKPGFLMSGWGLRASFHPETLELLKDVQTTYHANS